MHLAGALLRTRRRCETARHHCPKNCLAWAAFPPIMAPVRRRPGAAPTASCPFNLSNQPVHGAPMEELLAQELVKIMKKETNAQFEEAFERAFELTKAYASSANAQASAIPFVFEKVFELFVTGNTKN